MRYEACLPVLEPLDKLGQIAHERTELQREDGGEIQDLGRSAGLHRSCENKGLIARKRLEDKLVAALSDKVLKPEVLHAVYERTAKKIKEHFAHVPEELRLKKVELNRAETRVHNFIEFIAAGRATPGLADALGQAEEQVKTLSADVVSMASAKDHAFTPPPPPRAWIADRLTRLQELLGTRTEQSALALRRLTGPVTLTPTRPEVGKPYFMVGCTFDSLSLLADGGLNLLGRDSFRPPSPLRRFEAKTYRRGVVLQLGTRVEGVLANRSPRHHHEP